MAQELQKSEEQAAGRGTIEGGQTHRERNPIRITAEPGKQEVFVVREFDAPRELVFRAYTDPELFRQWIGPRGLSTRIETFESRNGGSWRYVQTDEEGNEYGFHGVNHDLTPPERIIQTFEFEGLPESGHAVLDVAKFEELPGNRTKFTGQSVFLSVEDRDGMMESDMEEGMKDTFSRLDELLERLQK
ncbi:SRPBCC family protein [Methanoculleus sediminis]|uniref:SRPBCC family protein n=1 Tax=Methanoculleus sediminis TaxID=1550566 RepID=UPI0009E34BB8|nr:SRPBCC family protein [Methanoculleus sediminis]